MTPTQTQLLVSPEALLALGRLSHLGLTSNAATRKLRADLPPGQHKGEAQFTLAYDLTVGEDHEAEVSQSVPWKQIAGALFGKLNTATRDKLVRELLGDDFTVLPDAVNAKAEAAIAALIGKTTKTVAGKITGSATLTPIE